MPSTNISVWMPRSRTPLSFSEAHTAFGMPPMPIWRQAPSSISPAIRAATRRSTSLGSGFASSGSGSSEPSMT